MRDDRPVSAAGGGAVIGEAALVGRGDDGTGGLAVFAGREPSPECDAMVTDEFRRLFTLLPSEDHRRIAAMKLEGLSDQEIAERLDRGSRTVERKLAVIRTSWTSEMLG